MVRCSIPTSHVCYSVEAGCTGPRLGTGAWLDDLPIVSVEDPEPQFVPKEGFGTWEADSVRGLGCGRGMFPGQDLTVPVTQEGPTGNPASPLGLGCGR